jgi:mycothiol synthase
MRPYVGETDFVRVDALMRTTPATTPHIFDFPWRFSSPTSQTGRDIYVWQDDTRGGELLAFAAWQRYWSLLDFTVLPGPWQAEIESQLFAWAELHFQTLNRENGNTYPYWVEFRDDDVERKALATRYGYTIENKTPYVFLERSLVDALPESGLPDGFTFRSLRSDEAEAYTALHRAAFESTSMTADWRTRTLSAPRHSYDFDIVAAAPDGTLAGFCVAWFDELRRVGQIEPMGVHPAFHHMGLARALLLEMFRRFQQHGAQTIHVETEDDRGPARAAYESVGFRVVHRLWMLGKYV